MKSLRSLASLLALGALVLAGCNSASVEQSWKDPALQKIEFKKILVLAPSTDGAIRRTVEDTVAKSVTGVEVVPGYTVLPDVESTRQLALVREAAERSDADGIVVLRLVANREELNYGAGGAYPVPYATLGGYWGTTRRTVAYSTPMPTTDRIVVVETNIYDVKTEKLIWSGTTESYNPGKLENLVTDASAAVIAELRKQKLIPEKK
ncbi:MAG: hypothetical protein H7067_13945 [Burkholderiales bacterium]|nr:hypothetical protein [Opitutaceae bacterium]